MGSQKNAAGYLPIRQDHDDLPHWLDPDTKLGTDHTGPSSDEAGDEGDERVEPDQVNVPKWRRPSVRSTLSTSHALRPI
jgi:hypothetical protein